MLCLRESFCGFPRATAAMVHIQTTPVSGGLPHNRAAGARHVWSFSLALSPGCHKVERQPTQSTAVLFLFL